VFRHGSADTHNPISRSWNTDSNRARKSVHHHIGIPVHHRLNNLFTINWNCFHVGSEYAPSVFGWLSIHSFSIRSSRERRLALVIRRFRSKTARYADGPLRRYENSNRRSDLPEPLSVDAGSYYRVSVTDPSGGSVTHRDACVRWPHSIKTYPPKRSGIATPCPEKSKNIRILGMRFSLFFFSYLYMESQAPNKKLTTRRGCGYGLHSAQDI